MKSTETNGLRPRVVLGVTSDISLRLLRNFPEFLAERGWDVHVVCSSGPLLQERTDSGFVTYHELPMERRPSIQKDLRALWSWIILLRRLRPTLISVGTPKAALLGGIAAAIVRVPRRVNHQRGLVVETASGAGRVILWVTEWMSLAASTTVLAVSKSLRQVLIDMRLARPAKIVVLGEGSSNGVDTAEFAPERFSNAQTDAIREELRLPNDGRVVGYVGRVTVDKGFLVLADALRQMKSAERASLLVVGEAEDEPSRAALRGLVDSGYSVSVTGAVRDPSPYFQMMDVLCLPTFREGLPNVVLEASAAARPTVTTDATGAVDAVVAGRTGLVVPKGDSGQLADALTQLLGDPARRLAMGEAARRWVKDNFERAAVWRQIEQFYRGLVEGTR